MVDVSAKDVTRRSARASGELRMRPDALHALAEGRLLKGDALAVARLAGVQAAKRTAELIPLCHPLPLDHVAVEVDIDPDLPGVRVRCEAVAVARTGVEMEALTAAAGALLALYDMVKSLDRGMEIAGIRLEEKSGGRSGTYVRPAVVGGLIWAALAFVTGCGASDPTPTPAGERPSGRAWVADTQYVIDSTGAQLEIIIGRPAPDIEEVIPRAGSQNPDAPDAYRTIEPRTAHSLMQAASPEWYVIDLRPDQVFVTGHLKEAKLVPFEILEENLNDLHVRTDQVVLVYAEGTHRAHEAARLLAAHGFPHVRVLEGGLAAWRQAGLPIEELP